MEKFNKYNYIQNLIVFVTLYFIILCSILFSNYNTYYIFNMCVNMCVLTSEFILSKMGSKNLPYFLIILFIVSQFNNIIICKIEDSEYINSTISNNALNKFTKNIDNYEIIKSGSMHPEWFKKNQN